MKKIITVLLALLMISIMSVQIMAGPEGVIENGPIDTPKVSPTVDGNITETEGWSVAASMDYDTLGFFWHVNPLTFKGTVKFAYDDEYFYYAADLTDGLESVHEITGEVIPAGTNEFVYSSGTDDIDIKDDGSAFGYNGDVFGMLIDPAGILANNGFTGNEDNSPWYMVGLFEGDVARMYREKVNAGDITDKVKVAGHKTATGWCLEAGIPWDMIIEDIENISYGDCVIDKAELLSDKSLVRAGAMYHDRFNDPEAGEVATWGCFVTVPSTMADGTPGHMGTGTNVKSLGLNLYLEAKDQVGEDTTASDSTATTDAPATDSGSDTVTEETETAFVEVTDDKGNAVTDASGNKVTQKVTVKVTSKATAKATTKKATTGTAAGGNAAQTFDIGIAAAIGSLAVSGIVYKGAKKRK
ncbi:MAG: hypothetical protein IJA55_09175 [Clostridia bacterium]|nr:hypothetical protein [Clostridia bacterium]